MAGNFKIDPDYVDVAERIREFKAAYPDGTLQPLDHDNPYIVQEVGGETLIVYRAAAYRAPDDPRPGIGVASEPFPGRTPYTKGSEIQNAETSAWGRAIVALGIPTKRVASAEEVRPRQAEREQREAVPTPEAKSPEGNGHITRTQARNLHDMLYSKGRTSEWFLGKLAQKDIGDGEHLTSIPAAEYESLLKIVRDFPDVVEEPAVDAQETEPEPPVADETTEPQGDPDPLTPSEQAFLDETAGNGKKPDLPEPTGKKGTITPAQLTRLGAMCADLQAEGIGESEWRFKLAEAEGVAHRGELTKTAATRVIDAFSAWLTDLQSGVKGAA